MSARPQATEQAPRFHSWRRQPPAMGAGFDADPGAGDALLSVGSLQKPFVAKAWAMAHPGELPPRFSCDASSGCWFRGGHGELDLVQALAVSCNTYFLRLAAATPTATLTSTLASEGFSAQPLTPELAIGLPGQNGPLTIRPSALLDAYDRLIKFPWPTGEPIRRQVLAGLREAALTGTASALGQRGYWAKTGTVPSEDGNPLHTCGFAIAVDDSGWAILARLDPGTGREAAAGLAGTLARLRPGGMARQSSPHSTSHPDLWQAGTNPRKSEALSILHEVSADPVRVRLLDLLGARHVVVRNLEAAPVARNSGFLGAGASLDLCAGDRVGPGLLELQEPGTGLLRRFQGVVFCGRTSGGAKRITAIMARREYVAGVVAAELPQGSSERRVQLGAAVLRFLARGPRHADADVCDSTHCAWFIGRGPRLTWPTPQRAHHLPAQNSEIVPGLSDEEWTRLVLAARQPGPSFWTSHCGGRPLSPHAIWGNGDTHAPACARHQGDDPAQTHPWVREWKSSDVLKAFGGEPERLEIRNEAGVWTLHITDPQGSRSLRYDDAHRLIARVLGWDALPSPADHIEPIPGGYRVRGVGSGHRVGLCLGE